MKALSPGCVSKILKYAVNKERNKGEFIPEDLNLMRVKLVLQFKIMPILGCNAWNVLLRFITTGFFYKTMLCNPNNNIFGLISALSPTAVSPTQDVTQIKGQKCFLDNNYCDKRPTKTYQRPRNRPLMSLDVNMTVQCDVLLRSFSWPLPCYFITARQIAVS